MPQKGQVLTLDRRLDYTSAMQKLLSPNLQFPCDHFMHHDVVEEWWYFTGKIEGGQKKFAYTYTVFKEINATVPPGQYVYNALFQLVDMDSGKKHLIEASAFGNGSDLQTDHLNLVVEEGTTKFGLAYDPPSDQWALVVESQSSEVSKFLLSLIPREDRGYVANGVDGLIHQGDAGLSVYYSAQSMNAKGEIDFADKSGISVTGDKSWYDHQWGNFTFNGGGFGYDWFSFRFDDNSGLMLYKFKDGSKTGTFQSAQDRAGTLVREFTAEPVAGSPVFTPPGLPDRHLPLRWHVQVPELGIDVKFTASPSDQWVASRNVLAFYEGIGEVDEGLSGICFLEM